jgi:iron complex transport system substrate-binding protein
MSRTGPDLAIREIDAGRRRLCRALLCGSTLLALRPLAAAGRDVIYYGDRHLRLPDRIERIATTWEAQNSIIAMLGFADRIVATTRLVRDMPVFRRFVPSIAHAALAGAGADLNIEQLLRLRPDVLFAAAGLPQVRQAQLERAGIAVAVLRSNSVTALLERTTISAEILGGTAVQRAQDYRAYFASNVERVATALAKVPQSSRLKVYHCLGGVLGTSGRPSLNQDWMDLGGALNVAEHWFQHAPAQGKVSLEQIYAAEPDLIVAMTASEAARIRSEPAWRSLKAVREGRVYANPRGMFWWSRETSELALQFLWLAKTLYPDALSDVDMRMETREFYQRFYGYRLEHADIEEFLQPTEHL